MAHIMDALWNGNVAHKDELWKLQCKNPLYDRIEGFRFALEHVMDSKEREALMEIESTYLQIIDEASEAAFKKGFAMAVKLILGANE